MCGIIAINSRPSSRPVPSTESIVEGLDHAAMEASSADTLLRGVPGVRALVGRHELIAAITARLDQLDATVATAEAQIEAAAADPSFDVEVANGTLGRLRDAIWAIRNDRLRSARLVAELAGTESGVASIAGYFTIQQALSALDRLEVRGRDSAGIHLFVWGHG